MFLAQNGKIVKIMILFVVFTVKAEQKNSQPYEEFKEAVNNINLQIGIGENMAIEGKINERQLRWIISTMEELRIEEIRKFPTIRLEERDQLIQDLVNMFDGLRNSFSNFIEEDFRKNYDYLYDSIRDFSIKDIEKKIEEIKTEIRKFDEKLRTQEIAESLIDGIEAVSPHKKFFDNCRSAVLTPCHDPCSVEIGICTKTLYQKVDKFELFKIQGREARFKYLRARAHGIVSALLPSSFCSSKCLVDLPPVTPKPPPIIRTGEAVFSRQLREKLGSKIKEFCSDFFEKVESNNLKTHDQRIKFCENHEFLRCFVSQKKTGPSQQLNYLINPVALCSYAFDTQNVLVPNAESMTELDFIYLRASQIQGKKSMAKERLQIQNECEDHIFTRFVRFDPPPQINEELCFEKNDHIQIEIKDSPAVQ